MATLTTTKRMTTSVVHANGRVEDHHDRHHDDHDEDVAAAMRDDDEHPDVDLDDDHDDRDGTDDSDLLCSSSSSSPPSTLRRLCTHICAYLCCCPSRATPRTSKPNHALPRSLLERTRHTLAFLLTRLLCIFLILIAFHGLVMNMQRDRLRSTVLHSSQVLSAYELSYWWDFGTFLGLAREHDIIFTEVDADISVTLDARNVLADDQSAARHALAQNGFVLFEKRDETKLRIYDSWGFFLDMDVWEHDTVDRSRMQMLTGRLEPEIYNIPASFIFPLSHIHVPTLWTWVCRPLPATPVFLSSSDTPAVKSGSVGAVGGGDLASQAMASDKAHGGVNSPTSTAESFGSSLSPVERSSLFFIPHDADAMLTHWYGETWPIPRHFDKGVDHSSDAVEVFLWRYAMWAFEVFLAVKVVARTAFWGATYHPLMMFYLCAATIASHELLRRVARRLRRRRTVHASCKGASSASPLSSALSSSLPASSSSSLSSTSSSEAAVSLSVKSSDERRSNDWRPVTTADSFESHAESADSSVRAFQRACWPVPAALGLVVLHMHAMLAALRFLESPTSGSIFPPLAYVSIGITWPVVSSAFALGVVVAIDVAYRLVVYAYGMHLMRSARK